MALYFQILATQMNNSTPTSWADFPVMPTLDPRTVIQSAALADNGGTLRTATFTRASNFLSAGPWVNPVISLAATPGTVTVPNTYDYGSIEEANNWNALVQMNTSNIATLPSNVTNIIFLKAGTAFVNNLYIDWSGAISSQLIYLTFRDNALTSGDFQNSGTGTIPAFVFPVTATYSGGGRNLQLTLLKPGRFDMVLWVRDNAGNVSSYDLQMIVLP